MGKSVELMIGVAGSAAVTLAAFAVYRWRMRQRVRRVEWQVKDFLADRYGGLPDHLSINCSDDPLWPVLVGFDNARTGTQHRLQFACGGRRSTFSLLSEMVNQR